MISLDNKQLIGRGRTAEIYAWGDCTVLKLFNLGFPSGLVDREARIAGFVSQSSLPTPKLIDTITINNREGLIFERACGYSMFKLVTSRPLHLNDLNKYAALFANLHFMIHNNSGEGLPQIKPGIQRSINQVKVLNPELKSYVLDILEKLPDGNSLCHFDFHPDQVIITPDGPKIIDWMNGYQGDPLADIAQTSVMLKYGSVIIDNFFIRNFIYFIKGFFYRKYMKEYFSLNNKADLDMIKLWMIPVATARLNEGIPGEASRIMSFIEKSMKKHYR